jgi:uncharacterized tellurite resistance protein B-like protein
LLRTQRGNRSKENSTEARIIKYIKYWKSGLFLESVLILVFEQVRDFFSKIEQDPFKGLSERELQIAACILLLETAFIDYEFPETEQRVILQAITSLCGLDPSNAQELFDIAELARIEGKRRTLFFTAINSHLNAAQKMMLYACIWKVIKADDKIHSKELRAATKLGELLELSVKQQIEARAMIIHGRFPF